MSLLSLMSRTARAEMGYLLDLAIGRLESERSPSPVDVADRESSEERAAILEYDAGYSRAEAERVAGILH